MNKKDLILYCVTAGWALVTVATGLYYLTNSMAPAADVEAYSQNSPLAIPLENWEPGEVRTYLFDEKPIVVWRRDPAEIATAMAQFDPDVSKEKWLQVLNDGTLASEIGADAYTRMEWFIVSPVNVGGYGCITRAKAGDYEGFFDPCQAVHFDMWGRKMKGPTKENLKVPPFQFTEDGRAVFLDLSEMPSAK